MNERIVAYTFNLADPDETGAVGEEEVVFMVPFAATLIYASVSPREDDAGATMDIQDDGTDTAAVGIDASDHDVPGEWISTHCGGTNDPIAITAGSEMSLDFNNAAAANRFDVVLLFLTGEGWG